MVWGVRMLVGNDNEWRYIFVRRFFSVIEELVKKVTLFVVFELNDVFIWIKVKSMISSIVNLE